MECRAYIYKKLLIPTGKYYIGKHNGKKNSYLGSGTDWLLDLKKYSNNHKLNIKTEILEYVDDISKLNDRETYWLQYFNVANNPEFYNRSNISHGCHITKESTKVIQSLNSPKRKKIIQYDLDGNFIKIWGCMNDVYKKLNINVGDLTCVCQGKQKTAGGYQWIYYNERYLNVIPSVKKYQKPLNFNNMSPLKGISRPKEHIMGRYKPIIQIDKQNNIIKEWNYIREACTQFGGDINKIESNINGCLKNKQKTAYGFIWRYKT
jgi:hypothetical protein